MTLAPFLKARVHKESSTVEKQAEAFDRIVSVLLQGIALHAFNDDPAAFAMFGKAMKKMRMEFEEASGEAEAVLLACGAIHLLEEHNEAAERRLHARQNEMETVISLLSETILDVARAAPEVMVRVKEIEKDLCLSTEPEAMTAARVRLEACLGGLRAEAHANPLEPQSPAWPSAETDTVTGLPDAGLATAAIDRIWSRRMESYAAVLALERLDTINTRFGLPAGDQLLSLLGRHIAARLTSPDQLFRWRGPCLLILMERHLPEALVTAELARLAPLRLEAALTFRDREVMVPISAAWNLIPLSCLRGPEDLVRRLNEFAGSQSPRRKVSAAGV